MVTAGQERFQLHLKTSHRQILPLLSLFKVFSRSRGDLRAPRGELSSTRPTNTTEHKHLLFSNMRPASSFLSTLTPHAITPHGLQHSDKSSIGEPLWKQSDTLRPPPYTGPMACLLHGLQMGDPFPDSMSLSDLLKTIHLQIPPEMQSPDPEWVDWESIRRGQAHWMKYGFAMLESLSAVLVLGFVIGRFSDVLVHTGYSSSEYSAWVRFYHTSAAVVNWFSHPLDEPSSLARQSLYRVRLMHGYARRVAQEKEPQFGPGREGSIALCQYDLAEVLMGFSVVCLHILHDAYGVVLSEAEQEDFVHCWRLIGYHLGISDQYNPCTSVAHLRKLYADYLLWTHLRFAHLRQSTFQMQDVVIRAFGRYGLVGQRLWAAKVVHWLQVIEDTIIPGTDLSAGVGISCHPAMMLATRWYAERVSRRAGVRPMTSQMVELMNNEDLRRRYESKARMISLALDWLVWPLYCTVYDVATSGLAVVAMVTRGVHWVLGVPTWPKSARVD